MNERDIEEMHGCRVRMKSTVDKSSDIITRCDPRGITRIRQMREFFKLVNFLNTAGRVDVSANRYSSRPHTFPLSLIIRTLV